MNQQDRDHFDEIILRAVQATKQENSGLILSIKRDLDNLKVSTDEFHIKNDDRWKENEQRWIEALPVIQMGKNIAGFSIVMKWVLAAMVAIGSIYGGFEWFQNVIKK